LTYEGVILLALK